MAMASTKVGAGLLYHAAFRWVIGPRFCSEWAARVIQEKGRLVQEFFQRGQTHAFHPGAAVLTWPARWCRGIESRVQTQSGDEGNGFPEGLAEMEQVQDSVATVPHQHQWPARQPATELQDHLAGPVRKLYVREESGQLTLSLAFVYVLYKVQLISVVYSQLGQRVHQQVQLYPAGQASQLLAAMPGPRLT